MPLLPSVQVLIALAASAVLGVYAPADVGIASPNREDIFLAPDSEMVPARVSPRATLAGMLQAHRVHQDDITGILSAMAGVFDARRLRADQPWRFERTLDGCVRYLEYEIDAVRYLHVAAGAGDPHAFTAEVVPYEVQSQGATVEATIDAASPSLFAALTAGGESADLAMALAEIFGGEVDFNSDLQRGDTFRLAVDKVFRDGRFVRYGPVLAAEVWNAGRRLVAVRYAPPGGAAGYYDAAGRSMKRFFLRSPLRFDPQVTSGFSRARMHPVLHRMRAHLGVDYRAPVGAPVIAVASGVVTGAGWRGGGGRTVSIRHASGYESFYLHLSAIGPGIRPGARVAQGQMIGRVGATGLATGPHLDYRLKKNGIFVNPLTEHRRLPPGEPVAPQHLAAFAAERDAVLSGLGAGDAGLQSARVR